jgi:hypothetical protein
MLVYLRTRPELDSGSATFSSSRGPDSRSTTISSSRASRLVFVVLLAMIMAALPTRAFAQMRPFEGLFGTDTSRQHSLVFNFSLYGGYDDNVVGSGQSGGTASRAAQVGSTLYGFSAGLDYSHSGRRLTFGASADTGARYFPEQSDLSASNYGVGAGLGYLLTRYTRVSVSQAVSYRPRYQLGLLDGVDNPALGGSLPSNLDYVVAKRESWIYRTTATLDRQLGRNTDVALLYGFRKQDFSGISGAELQTPEVPATVTGTNTPNVTPDTPQFVGTYRDVTSQTAGVRLHHRLTRNAGVRLGYTYTYADYPPPQARLVESHIFDVGIDYAKAFSPSRRTTLSFSTGSGMIDREGEQHWHFTGTANLNHQFSRVWVGNVRYRRGYAFQDAFDEPFFTDTVTAGLTGLFNPRVRWNLQGGYTSGQVGLQDRSDTGVQTVSGSTSIDYVITPLLSAFAQYVYYQYEFQQGVRLPVGLDRRFDRQGVRVGLMLRLPLIQ